MPLFKITYTTDHEPEVVEADRVEVQESSGQVVLYKSILVITTPREIVVRRQAGRQVQAVQQMEEPT